MKQSLDLKAPKRVSGKERKAHIGFLYDSKDRKVPCLRCSGKWLRESGLEIGTEIIIQSEADKIIIKKA